MPTNRLLFVSLLAVAGLGTRALLAPAQERDSHSPEATDLIAKLDATGNRDRENAAEALAELDDARIVPALRAHLKLERDYHVRLAMHYSLASQGEKESIRELIASLRSSGHMGANYLRRVSGKDFGWDVAQWESWDQGISAENFRKRAKERIAQRPAREEWEKFISLYGAQTFERFDPGGTKERLSADDRKQLIELPTAKAWALFQSAIAALQDEGDKALGAKRFREVATKYAGTYYAKDAKELADLLERMVEEDRAWKEPTDISLLSKTQRVAYHVYHLRDVVAHQWSQPGYCNVLADSLLAEEKSNAAKELLALGDEAIPALLDLLDDRRPIRGVGYWRDFHPTRTVLRYQDAAIQILNEIMPGEIYVRRSTSSYLSTEDPDERSKLNDRVRKSWQRDKDKSALQRRWSAVDDLGIQPALNLLAELAEAPSQKPNVLKKLNEMYDKRHWVYQPRIAELMARLGDTSKVQEVLKHHRDGRYSKYLIQQPDDSAASLNADDAAKRLGEKYAEQKK